MCQSILQDEADIDKKLNPSCVTGPSQSWISKRHPPHEPHMRLASTLVDAEIPDFLAVF